MPICYGKCIFPLNPKTKLCIRKKYLFRNDVERRYNIMIMNSGSIIRNDISILIPIILRANTVVGVIMGKILIAHITSKVEHAI